MNLAEYALALRVAKNWVKGVTSDALDLPQGLFNRSCKGIARGLKKSALQSSRRKGTAFQSAMSMLNFYINRAGKALSKADRKRLECAKVELRKLFKK